VKKKVGRPCKYGENDHVIQVPLYLPESVIKRLPDAYTNRNEWLVRTIMKELKKEGK
jgi:hypothetical protein